MHPSFPTLLIVAAVTYVSWRERRHITHALEDEWTTFLRELA